MPTRRTLLAMSFVCAIAADIAPAGADDLSQAAEFIRSAGNELRAVSEAATSPEDRRRRMDAFIGKVVDVDRVAQFCLGRYWSRATPAQQQEFRTLFRAVLLNGVLGRMGDYQGGPVKVDVGRPRETQDGIIVPTVVQRPNNPPANVSWLVSMEGSSPRILDVSAEGMSLRLTQRSDYAAFLSRNNSDVGALLQAIRAQLAQG